MYALYLLFTISLTKEEQQEYISTNSDQVSCYCDQYSVITQSKDKHCRHYFFESVRSEVLTYFASLIVVAVNQLMEYLVSQLSRLLLMSCFVLNASTEYNSLRELPFSRSITQRTARVGASSSDCSC